MLNNSNKRAPKDESSFKSSLSSFQLLASQKDDIDLSKSDSSKFTLRFKSSSLEKDFRKYYHSETYSKAKYAVAVILLVEFISVIFDFLFIVSYSNQESLDNTEVLTKVWPLIFMRFFVCLVFLCTGIITVLIRLNAYNLQYLLSCTTFIALCTFISQYIMIFRLLHSTLYASHFVAHVILTEVYILAFSTLLFPHAMTTCCIFWSLTFIPIAFGVEVSWTITLSLIIAGVTIVMGLVNYTNEIFTRQRYLLMRNVEQERAKIETEKSISQGLLLNIFPKVIIEKFKRDKATIVEEFSDVTIFFSDIVSFTQHSSNQTPIQLVNLLNDMFSRFDEIVGKYKLEKIKTIGDAYMAVGGVPVPSPSHAEAVANMSLEVLEALKDFNEKNIKALGGKPWNIRIGLHTGSVVAGVIGKKKYLYDLYGESVTTATLMESSGSPGKIHVSQDTYEQLKNKFNFTEEKAVQLKEGESMKTYFLVGKKEVTAEFPNLIDDGPSSAEHLNARFPALSLSIANPIWKHLNQGIDELTNIKLHKFTLAFPLKEIEKEFSKYFLEKNLVYTRVGVCVMLFVLCALELIDPILRGSGSQTSKIVMRAMRYGTVAPSCVALFIYSFFNPEEKRIQTGIAVSVILFYINWVVGGFFSQLHFMGLVFGHLSAFFMMKLNFKYAAITGIFFQVVFVISAGIVGFVSLLGVFMTLTGVFMYGILSSYQFEKYLRMTFVNEKLLDMEKERLKIEQAKSEELLVNLLPASIAHSLKSGEQTIANKFSNITIMFVHIVGLTSLQHDLELKELFKLVNQIFCKYDDLTDIYKIEKIKTIGSSYMLASGLDNFNIDSKEILKSQNKKMIEIALEMIQYIHEFVEDSKRKSRANLLFDLSSVPNLNIRVGIHMGPIVAGVIGKKKFTYDVWGDVVNVASRMESTGVPGHIQVTEKIYDIMREDYKFEERGEIEVKGKGKMKTYFLLHNKNKTGSMLVPPNYKETNGGHH